MVFFELEWASLEDEKAAFLLNDPALGKYGHYLTKLRKYRPHLLSEQKKNSLQRCLRSAQAAEQSF